jgi:hypothetical protein
VSIYSICPIYLLAIRSQTLYASFRNPSSPFYSPPGVPGPSSPTDHPTSSGAVEREPEQTHEELLARGMKQIQAAGFRPEVVWPQSIVWGDHDSFQHVNNVRYVRFFETSRIGWMRHVGNLIGGSAKAEGFIRGKGVSLILKSIKVDFRRPVTYPDTVRLISSSRPLLCRVLPC